MKHWFEVLSASLQSPVVRNPVAVSFGAVGGALCRYYLGRWLTQLLGVAFPYGTFFVNITGSFLMGLLVSLLTTQVIQLSPEVRSLILVGFLGSYTTFSSYELESFKLFNDGRFFVLSLYWLGSAVLGLLAVYGGIKFGHFLND
ncbi:fluoride efflux transporter CrcB [Spirulina sp. CS-785/01]|uniref:fluoride efflux transporter CrcB n=1 Tax=Spirulina sp. CS-785/01 TaxID=3021716 RepID=UPI00232D0858|nr:fluoride efflux transporter CrcB [Spirulina sp. CS-785/01]MDB9312863.1 fluoride efflux transporter CrcB [Spirulina sp. CS-785/01]